MRDEWHIDATRAMGMGIVDGKWQIATADGMLDVRALPFTIYHLPFAICDLPLQSGRHVSGVPGGSLDL
jgi:hypothetical protein